jgi:hypothetical protein
MAWATIRRATQDDMEELEKRAAAFRERHGIEQPPMTNSALWAVTAAIAAPQDEGQRKRRKRLYLRRLWLGVVRGALRHNRAEGISHGYIGFHVD